MTLDELDRLRKICEEAHSKFLMLPDDVDSRAQDLTGIIRDMVAAENDFVQAAHVAMPILISENETLIGLLQEVVDGSIVIEEELLERLKEMIEDGP